MAEALELLDSIEAKSWSRSVNSADRLLKLLPSPAWAETAPGCTIWTPEEKDASQMLDILRGHAMHWLSCWIRPGLSWESDDEWPAPAKLKLATQRLLEMGQNASVSANTVPTAS